MDQDLNPQFLVENSPCLSHSVCIQLHLYPTPCVFHSYISLRVSHSVCIPLRVYSTLCVFYSVYTTPCVPLHVYFTPYISHSVYPTSCVSHSVYPTPCIPLRVYPTPYIPLRVFHSVYNLILCLSYSVSIQLRVYFTLISHSVSHSMRIPLRVCPTPISYSVCPTPWFPLLVCPTLCVPLLVCPTCVRLVYSTRLSNRMSHSLCPTSYSFYASVCECLPAFVQSIFRVYIQKRSRCIIFRPVYARLLKLCATIRAKLCRFKPELSFSLFNCIHKKLCTIWCRRCRFDLWSNTCPYLHLYGFETW